MECTCAHTWNGLFHLMTNHKFSPGATQIKKPQPKRTHVRTLKYSWFVRSVGMYQLKLSVDIFALDSVSHFMGFSFVSRTHFFPADDAMWIFMCVQKSAQIEWTQAIFTPSLSRQIHYHSHLTRATLQISTEPKQKRRWWKWMCVHLCK